MSDIYSSVSLQELGDANKQEEEEMARRIGYFVGRPAHYGTTCHVSGGEEEGHHQHHRNVHLHGGQGGRPDDEYPILLNKPLPVYPLNLRRGN